MVLTEPSSAEPSTSLLSVGTQQTTGVKQPTQWVEERGQLYIN